MEATPLATLTSKRDATHTDLLVGALAEDVGAALAPYVGDGGLVFPQEVHVVLGNT